MTIIDIEKEIEQLIMSGLYKVVDLDLFKPSINISDYNQEYFEETLIDYKKYLEMIEQLPEKYRTAFLQTLKRGEIKHNQEVENENTFMVELYHSLGAHNSIDLAVSLSDKNITQEDIKLLHNKLMQGTDYEQKYDYRDKNNITVEGVFGGSRDIHFIPIDKDKIGNAMQLICDYLNKDNVEEQDILVKPFTAHALIAALQAFPDGNTRLARLICFIKIWELSKKCGITNVNLPAIYLSKNFFMMRNSYRDNIRRIVVDNDDAAWNKWYTFNLHAFNE